MASATTGRARETKRSRARQREAFLSHFAANCNVTAAAAAAGVTPNTLYRWRRDEPDFAEAWAEALAMGYQMLEARLVAHALAGTPGEELDGVEDIAAAPIHVELALKLMSVQRHSAMKGFPGRPRKQVPREEMLKVLLARLDLIERRKRAAAEREAALATEHIEPVAEPRA